MARPTCLYCGAPLPAGADAPAPEPAPVPPIVDRALLVLDLHQGDPGVLAEALGLSLFDARQRVSAGGYQLHRALPRVPAEEEAARLERAGLAVRLVSAEEATARGRPQVVRGGEERDDGLLLHTGEGSLRVTPGSLFLVVRGPITREYQTSPEVKRVRTATLEGAIASIHRHDDPRPLELDPLAFDFAAAAVPSLSSLLTILDWLARASPGTAVDDGFRRLTPALAPEQKEAAGRLSAAEALRAPRSASASDAR
jgi:hypothetical protein